MRRPTKKNHKATNGVRWCVLQSRCKISDLGCADGVTSRVEVKNVGAPHTQNFLADSPISISGINGCYILFPPFNPRFQNRILSFLTLSDVDISPPLSP
ncbi:hypothetical protein L1887_08981 [Cichorium endivia]|nr:hypothetical protein L1887_08981 [Cichorium endivia]